VTQVFSAPAGRWATSNGVRTITFPQDRPLMLSGGSALSGLTIAFETYGPLNTERSNAVLVCHALTGDQYVASPNPVTGRPAWWPRIVGPGRPIDTNRFFVVCANVLGGCMGSSGPASAGADGRPYGPRFPLITIADMVRAQAMLLEALGVPDLFCVLGGSIGGMQALQWAASHPSKVFACVTAGTAARQSAQNIAFHEVGRQAIMADPDWCGGEYLERAVRPSKGLSVARMAAHVGYLSQGAVQRRFGRAHPERERGGFSFDADFQVESYLRHQGRTFTDRFDANSYLAITRAADTFDLAADFGGSLAQAFRECRTRFCAFSFSSDWHHPPEESKAIVRAQIAAGRMASLVEVKTEQGHDAFLLEEPQFEAALTGFIDAAAAARGLPYKAEAQG
jgi:homoserine O-acetyltransferase